MNKFEKKIKLMKNRTTAHSFKICRWLEFLIPLLPLEIQFNAIIQILLFLLL